MTWTFQRLPAGPSTFVYSILRNRVAAPWREVAAGLPRDAALRDLLTELIARGPFSHVFWECAPLTAATADQPFAFALIDAPSLARTEANPADFLDALGQQIEPVVQITNLGGDARLLVPRPLVEHRHYGDLCRFLRGAPALQVNALWAALGSAVSQHLAQGGKPLWVSTAGLGTPWLHVRLDSRPKYYRFEDYRRATS